MSSLPVLKLTDLRLAFGDRPLFEGLGLTLARGQRCALIGRNGAGKSTLMRIISGEAAPDTGTVWRMPAIRTVHLAQEPDLSGYTDLVDFACADLPEDERDERYRGEAELMAMGLDLGADPSRLSGGQTRRAALARAFAAAPDVLLLDEPTNHLDIPAIEALAQRLKSFRGALLTVSHDRRFLEEVSTDLIWLRFGQVWQIARGYGEFDGWAASIELEEERALSRLETQLKAEERWVARGVTARRRRNEGRLTRVRDMRADRQRMRGELGQIRAQAQLDASASELSSRKVFEVRGLTHGFDTPEGRLTVVRDLGLRIVRGDRVGLIGPNGAGKTTLLRLILGELAPDQGTSWRSPAAEIAYLDQTRARLNPQDTLWDTLAPYGGDQIMVQGQPRHVAAYAKDFLFRPEQMRQPVGALSGGERNRLTLALALARPSNVLVLDEPTNDLDMDTLDLLEDMLEAYEGTLILVSHDRSFLDNVVTSCLCAVGNGQWIETAGGYSDALSQLGRARLAGARLEPGSLAVPVAATASTPAPSATPKRAAKLSFKDTHRLKEIDALIPALNTEIARLERELSDPALFTRKPDRFKAASTRLLAARSELAKAEEDWLEIEARREALEQG